MHQQQGEEKYVRMTLVVPACVCDVNDLQLGNTLNNTLKSGRKLLDVYEQMQN